MLLLQRNILVRVKNLILETANFNHFTTDGTDLHGFLQYTSIQFTVKTALGIAAKILFVSLRTKRL